MNAHAPMKTAMTPTRFSNAVLARAAEVFFRQQRVSINDGAVMLADAETVNLHAESGGLGNLGRMLREVNAPLRSLELDVLDDGNHLEYFNRDERRDTALQINPGLPGSLALCGLLERWVGHWMDLPADERTRLGVGVTNMASRRLGSGAVLGARVWDRQHKVRLHIGPLTLAQYTSFLPPGDARPVLERWMQQLLGGELQWDAQLVLRREEVPPTRLGSAVAGRGGSGARLGWVSWLGSRVRTRDAADVRLPGDRLVMDT